MEGGAMRRENGVSVPGESFPLPWAVTPDHAGSFIGAANGEEIFTADRIEGTAEFAVYAANYHSRLAEIVRRLAQMKRYDDFADVWSVCDDAANLWAEMKGGGYEG
jgi:hypothetical protein